MLIPQEMSHIKGGMAKERAPLKVFSHQKEIAIFSGAGQSLQFTANDPVKSCAWEVSQNQAGPSEIHCRLCMLQRQSRERWSCTCVAT